MPNRISYIALCLKRLLRNKSYRYRILNYIFYLIIFSVIYMIILPYILSKKQIVLHKYSWIEQHNNLSHYITRPTSKDYTTLCPPQTKVLIGIISSPSHASEREAIRKSWLGHIPLSWNIIFFIGRSWNISTEVNVEEESRASGDIVKLNVEDNYLNLTIKVALFLKWVSLQCKHPKFILKADDDVFIHPKNMEHFINCCNTTIENMYNTEHQTECDQWKPKNIIGHFIDSVSRKYISYVAAGYLYNGVKPDRNPKSKWFLSKNSYPQEILPSFLSGTSYLISSNLIHYILIKVNEIPMISLEDAYITGLVLKKSMNLKLSNVDGWNNFRPQWDDPCLYDTILTAHGLNSQEMITITNSIYTIKNCTVINRLFSYFNKLISYYSPRLPESIKLE